MVDVGKQLAVASYIAVLPDCAGHGENASRQSMDFLEVMEKTASNIDVILEAYKNSQYADSSRFALEMCIRDRFYCSPVTACRHFKLPAS